MILEKCDSEDSKVGPHHSETRATESLRPKNVILNQNVPDF